MKGFTVESELTRISSRIDGSLSIGFSTKELNALEKVKIMEFHNNTGWMLFSPNPIEESDIPTKMAETGSKTPSQRMRAVIYILWNQGDKDRTFDQYYSDHMENIIQKLKDRIDQ